MIPCPLSCSIGSRNSLPLHQEVQNACHASPGTVQPCTSTCFGLWLRCRVQPKVSQPFEIGDPLFKVKNVCNTLIFTIKEYFKKASMKNLYNVFVCFKRLTEFLTLKAKDMWGMGAVRFLCSSLKMLLQCFMSPWDMPFVIPLCSLNPQVE